MFKKLRRTAEAENHHTIDELFTLTNIRLFLTALRQGEQRKAITKMECFLDVLIMSLTRKIRECKPSTKTLLIEELRRVKRYRAENEEDIVAFLETAEDDTRKDLAELRSRADKILEDLEDR